MKKYNVPKVIELYNEGFSAPEIAKLFNFFQGFP